MPMPSPDDSPAFPARVRALFEQAWELPPPEREPFVRKAAAKDTALAEEVLSWLRAKSEPSPTVQAPSVAAAAKASAHPTQIGPYRILELLGEGGMGSVFLAEQRTPVHRHVALKVIKLGMDSKAVVGRFEQERQALALMQHDGIAKVFDCGTTERGQLYFVMELVKGIPLNDYCDQQRLSLPDRLKLMQQVCAAVTHAHQKGVVHRDLKPGNVLVSEDGGKVQIKIIDFGLAKAMGQKLVEATLFTEAGQIVGTPEYMAPEQADPTNADIDTRADVYSLGVMLYEVLVGSLPFTGAELRKAGLMEMQRVLREVDPQKPSTRLSSIGGSSTAIAEARRISTGALQRALKNDLDWVALKALEKDRARRYDTANALAMDMQRFLEHEPLVAGPPSAGYRLKKLVRRYRGQVLAGSAVLATAIAGAVVAVQFAITADANATLAKGNETLATRRAEENALLAQEKTALAASETAAKETVQRTAAQLSATVRNFNQLSADVLYRRTVANEKELWPAWPDKVEAMERWLRDDCGKLLAMEPEIRRTVDDLRSQSSPLTPEQVDADRRSHPRFAEFTLLAKQVASLRYAQAIRSGQQSLVVPELTPMQQALDARALISLALERVAGNPLQRTVWGEEALGLAAARAAVAMDVGSHGAHAQYLNVLAWAMLANGQDAEAQAKSAEALATVPNKAKELFAGHLRDLGKMIEQSAAILSETESRLEKLTTQIGKRRTWLFAATADGEAAHFLHETLTEVLSKLASLAQKEKADVELRLRWAREVAAASQTHPLARVTWAAAREAIAKADGVVASTLYAGISIPLPDAAVMGLVPIGMNPVTKLWEFYELRSAWDGKQGLGEIPIPSHKADGSIEVTGATGIVFVLLPGGTVTLGSQDERKDAPYYDSQREPDERLHQVALSPFCFARHELTQGQWGRLMTSDATLRAPSKYKVGSTVAGKAITLANPVEQVNSAISDDLLARHGMVLPSEAQWEYGCRGGSATPWNVDFAQLKEVANVADAGAKAATLWRSFESWQDDHVAHAPVGTYRANAFGLFDVHGNVLEWCRDCYSEYGDERGGDGLRATNGVRSASRVARGGSFGEPAAQARSACRQSVAPSSPLSGLGLRPARLIAH